MAAQKRFALQGGALPPSTGKHEGLNWKSQGWAPPDPSFESGPWVRFFFGGMSGMSRPSQSRQIGAIASAGPRWVHQRVISADYAERFSTNQASSKASWAVGICLHKIKTTSYSPLPRVTGLLLRRRCVSRALAPASAPEKRNTKGNREMKDLITRKAGGKAESARTLLALILFAAFSWNVSAQVCTAGVCPSVEVTAPRIGGGTIICRGSDCADMLQGLQSNIADLWDQEQPLGPDEIAISKDDFCGALAASKPADCGTGPGVLNVPGVGISPHTYGLMYANGCGTGSTFEALANAHLPSTAIGSNYSGNPDNPMASSPNMSFRSSCVDHDVCYAGQLGQSYCDNVFASSLTSTCSASFGAGSDQHSLCQGFARLYSGAVGVFGHVRYQASEQTMRCALWNANMNLNSCPK
jgi:hypothetical protein